MKTTLRITDSFSLLTVVPVVLGHLPEDSVALLGFPRGGGQPMAARVDAHQSPADLDTTVDQVLQALHRAEIADVFVIGYYTTTDPASPRDDVAAFVDALTVAGLRVAAPVRVFGSQHTATAVFLVGDDPCPFPAPTLDDLPTGWGDLSHTRADLAQAVEPGARAERVGALLEGLRRSGDPVTPERAAVVVEAVLSGDLDALPDAVIAEAVQCLDDPAVRDRVMIGHAANVPWADGLLVGMRARLSGEHRMDQLVKWAALTPDPDAAPVLGCLIVAAFARGSGLIANVAADRLARLNAATPVLVETVLSLLANGHGPTVLP